MIWTLVIPGRPESINTFMKKVPKERARLKKPWRERACEFWFRRMVCDYPSSAVAHRNDWAGRNKPVDLFDRILSEFNIVPAPADDDEVWTALPVHVTFQPHLRHKRRQDVGACLLPAKACVDGLVDAGWLPDDSDEYVVGLTFRPAVYECDEDSLVMTIEEVSP